MNGIDLGADLCKFLTIIATNANPSRFFPFPDHFRVDPVPQNKTYSRDNPKNDSLISNENFKPYTQNDYNNLLQYLKRLEFAIENKEYDNHMLALIDYMFNQNLFISRMYYVQYEMYFLTKIDVKQRIIDYKEKQRWYMFHGTSISNLHAIIRTGGIINTSNTELMTTGAAHGSGIYCSDQLSVASQYGKYVFILELFEDPKKYHKVSNIFVLTMPQVSVRYLYVINQEYKEEPSLESFKIEVEKNLSQKSIIKRIEKEITQLKQIIDIESFDQLTCEIKATLANKSKVSILLENYPIKAPIITIDKDAYFGLDIGFVLTKYKGEELMIYEPIINDWNPSKRIVDSIQNIQHFLLTRN
jgi:hypothetical protein